MSRVVLPSGKGFRRGDDKAGVRKPSADLTQKDLAEAQLSRSRLGNVAAGLQVANAVTDLFGPALVGALSGGKDIKSEETAIGEAAAARARAGGKAKLDKVNALLAEEGVGEATHAAALNAKAQLERQYGIPAGAAPAAATQPAAPAPAPAAAPAALPRSSPLEQANQELIRLDATILDDASTRQMRAEAMGKRGAILRKQFALEKEGDAAKAAPAAPGRTVIPSKPVPAPVPRSPTVLVPPQILANERAAAQRLQNQAVRREQDAVRRQQEATTKAGQPPAAEAINPAEFPGTSLDELIPHLQAQFSKSGDPIDRKNYFEALKEKGRREAGITAPEAKVDLIGDPILSEPVVDPVEQARQKAIEDAGLMDYPRALAAIRGNPTAENVDEVLKRFDASVEAGIDVGLRATNAADFFTDGHIRRARAKLAEQVAKPKVLAPETVELRASQMETEKLRQGVAKQKAEAEKFKLEEEKKVAPFKVTKATEEALSATAKRKIDTAKSDDKVLKKYESAAKKAESEAGIKASKATLAAEKAKNAVLRDKLEREAINQLGRQRKAAAAASYAQAAKRTAEKDKLDAAAKDDKLTIEQARKAALGIIKQEATEEGKTVAEAKKRAAAIRKLIGQTYNPDTKKELGDELKKADDDAKASKARLIGKQNTAREIARATTVEGTLALLKPIPTETTPTGTPDADAELEAALKRAREGKGK